MSVDAQAMEAPALSREQLTDLLSAEFPEFLHSESGVTLESVVRGAAVVRQSYAPWMLRPGGTISGPTMMALTDFTMYVTLLSEIGWVPLAVTTQLGINFLRKPARAALLADGRVLKVGKRLAVIEVMMRSEGRDDPVAHSTATYSIPDQR